MTGELTPAAAFAPLPPEQPTGPLRLLTHSSGEQKWKIADGDRLLRGATRLAATVVLVLLIALIAVLGFAAVPSVRTFGFHFLLSRDWRPNVVGGQHPSLGALPVIYGTAVSSALALVFAVPLSLGAGLFLVRIAPRRLAGPVSFLVEFLAAIPSIAYGMWGLFVLAPFLQDHAEPPLNGVARSADHALYGLASHSSLLSRWLPAPPWFATPSTTGKDMLCGGLVLAIMILPIITAISRDILRQVPRGQVEGTVALGATWWQSSKEMLKYSRSGLFGAVMLGLARAAGETMAVTMVIGNNSQISASPFAAAQTMSSLLANKFAEADSELTRAALCEVALVLLLMSLLFNVIARYLVVGRSDSRGAAAH